MQKLILFTTLAFGLLTMQAQVGTVFPNMEGESLTNEFITLPKELEGKYSLVGLAFSKKAEAHLKTWFEPVFNQFIYKPENPGPFDFTYDINCYFVPMFTGAKRPAYQKVMKKLQKSIDKRLQPYVLFYKGQLKMYKESLNFDGKDIPYFYVLDPNGEIVYATSGRYTTQKMQVIVNAVDDALQMDGE